MPLVRRLAKVNNGVKLHAGPLGILTVPRARMYEQNDCVPRLARRAVFLCFDGVDPCPPRVYPVWSCWLSHRRP